jgi:hypothetical protein
MWFSQALQGRGASNGLDHIADGFKPARIEIV